MAGGFSNASVRSRGSQAQLFRSLRRQFFARRHVRRQRRSFRSPDSQAAKIFLAHYMYVRILTDRWKGVLARPSLFPLLQFADDRFSSENTGKTARRGPGAAIGPAAAAVVRAPRRRGVGRRPQRGAARGRGVSRRRVSPRLAGGVARRPWRWGRGAGLARRPRGLPRRRGPGDRRPRRHVLSPGAVCVGDRSHSDHCRPAEYRSRRSVGDRPGVALPARGGRAGDPAQRRRPNLSPLATGGRDQRRRGAAAATRRGPQRTDLGGRANAGDPAGTRTVRPRLAA